MGILFESSTPIEFLMKEALAKENFSFEEQYRIGTGGRFSTVKYVVDFLIKYEDVRLIVECDGRTYHSNFYQKRDQVERDAWLLKRHYKILHFSTEEIRHKMPFVISTIKYTLGMIDEIPLCMQNDDSKSYRYPYQEKYTVALYCYYSQIPQGVCVSYVYEDKTKNVRSEFRQKKCSDIGSGMAEVVAIYLALLDLKKSVNVHVFYEGQVFNDHFDVNKKIRSKLVSLKEGAELLKKHKFCFTHINIKAHHSISWLQKVEIMKELKEACLNSCKEILNGKEFEGYTYQSLLNNKQGNKI